MHWKTNLLIISALSLVVLLGPGSAPRGEPLRVPVTPGVGEPVRVAVEPTGRRAIPSRSVVGTPTRPLADPVMDRPGERSAGRKTAPKKGLAWLFGRPLSGKPTASALKSLARSAQESTRSGASGPRLPVAGR